MRSCRVHTTRLGAILFATILSLVAAIILPLSDVQAGAIGCRRDPIVTLSNGDVVTIMLDISVDASQVERIDYILYVPEGVTATSIVYFESTPYIPEELILQTGEAGEYKSETLVTAPNSAKVVVYMTYGEVTETVKGKATKPITAKIDIPETTE